jgi:hypothetical protein
MQKKEYLVLCAFAVLPFSFAATALAQSATPTQPSAANTYQLSGTSISGAIGATNTILTAPVPANAAAYKTESGIYLYPTAFVGAGYNDNLQATNAGEIGSSFVNLAPQLVAELKHKGDRYTALASLDATRYNNSADDNYTNSELQIAGDNYFSSRARAGWSVGRIGGIDPRGSTQRPISEQPDRWHTSNLDGRLIYGAPEASGRLEMDLGHVVKTYDNNRIYTETADLTLNSVAGRVFYRLGTRTLALAEIRDAKANYASALATDSNTDRRYYAGLTWEATAATTGIIKIGRMTKDFDQADRPGYSGGSWEAAVHWLPRTYSAFDLTTGRATADSTGYGNYTINTSTDLVWNHKWTQSLHSRMAAGVLKADFSGTNRTDTTNNYGLAVDYAVLRWLKLGVDFARTNNSSNDAAAAYKRNVTMLTLDASL